MALKDMHVGFVPSRRTFTPRKLRVRCPFYITTPLLLAILGHSSAASFPTGPVIALPFISPLGLTITPALSSK